MTRTGNVGLSYPMRGIEMRSKSRSGNVGRQPLFLVQPYHVEFVHFRLAAFCSAQVTDVP